MKVQKIYEDALAMIGKTEEGTSYPFADRVPTLLNSGIATLNLYRADDQQIESVETLRDELEISKKEARGLTLCLAFVAASETQGIPEMRVVQILKERNQAMGSFTTGMEDIVERTGV